jgi:V8-like Glu-specific endopeptidase
MQMSRRVLLAAGIAAAGLLAPPASALAAPPMHAKLKPRGTRAFWTPQRMKRAVPLGPAQVDSSASADAARAVPIPAYLSEAVPDPAAQPYPAVGKVFFKIDGGIYVCSASIVDSPGRSLVWTAGHCVRDAGRKGRFATKWIFVPGYDHGSAPYGSWPAKVLWTNRGWVKKNQHDDFAAAVLKPKNGQRVEGAVGSSLTLKPNPAYDQSWQAVGYPEAGIWGQNLWHCVSGLYREDRFRGSGPDPVGIGCDMTGGSSGGPWIAENGTLGAVTSYGYKNEPGALYGTYLGSQARKLYRKLRKKH